MLIGQKRIHALIQVAPLLALAVWASGCDHDAPSPEDMAKISTQALGIPVMLWAANDDECVKRQLGALYDEFVKAKPPAQKAIAESLKGYGAIIIQPSEDKGTLTGDHYELSLSQKICRTYSMPAPSMNGGEPQSEDEVFCDAETTKKLQASATPKTSSGQTLGTKVTKQAQPDDKPVLYITPTSAKDLASTKTVVTSDAGVYGAIAAAQGDGEQADRIEAATLTKSATVKSDKPDGGVACGKLVSFSDL